MSDEKKTLEERTKERLESMTPDEQAKFVSKHLMQAEWALEAVLRYLEDARESDESERLGMGYLAAKAGYHSIKDGHMRLTEADCLVFDRPIPRGR